MGKKKKENNPSLSMLHAEFKEFELQLRDVQNRMGYLEKDAVETKTSLTETKTNVEWLKKMFTSLSNRQWGLVAGTILIILLQIMFFLLKLS